jgi:enoyl-CoA hydratase/carnithine racemase
MTVSNGRTTPLQFLREGHVIELVLDQPPMNAIDTALQEALDDALTRIERDDSVRAVVLAGSDRIFAAGADISALAGMGYEEIVGWNRRLQRTFTRVSELQVPVVAAVTGHALGGGLELALAADYRVASSRARVGLPEILLGIMPGSGGTLRLTSVVGRSRAMELILSGRQITSDEALALGIVDEVTEPDQVRSRASEIAMSFARGPRFAVRAVKEAISHAAFGAAGLALERALIAGLFASDDKATGMKSFLDHGPGRARFD